MFHYFTAIQDKRGNALAGYCCKLIDPATGSVVSIFSDDAGTPIINVSGIADTAVVDSDGNVSLWVEEGEYHLDIYAPDAVTFVKRVPYVPMRSGPTGPAATVSIGTVTTGPAAVTNSGTSSAAVLNFTLPAAVWGGITGTLAAQTDLQNAINAKVDDTAYDATSWDGITSAAPSKNAVRDKIEVLDAAKANLTGATFTGAVKTSSPSGGVGYAAGAGGTVTQTTSKGTAVTLNKPCGSITTAADSLAAGSIQAFTLNNTLIAATDVVAVSLQTGSINYDLQVYQIASGSCRVSIHNRSTVALAEAIAINFAVIKAVAN